VWVSARACMCLYVCLTLLLATAVDEGSCQHWGGALATSPVVASALGRCTV
jgi:hypothetical protein